jgi:hypothetical protein
MKPIEQRVREWMRSTCPAAGGPRLWGEEPNGGDEPGCDCETTLISLLREVRDEAIEECADEMEAIHGSDTWANHLRQLKSANPPEEE